MQGFVRTVYCVSAKIPQDAAAHIVGRSHDYVDSIYKQARMVTGWAEFQKNKSMTFEAGILEVDSCRTATRKQGGVKETKNDKEASREHGCQETNFQSGSAWWSVSSRCQQKKKTKRVLSVA